MLGFINVEMKRQDSSQKAVGMRFPSPENINVVGHFRRKENDDRSPESGKGGKMVVRIQTGG